MPSQTITITAGGTANIAADNIFSTYYVTGTQTIASNFEVAMTGTPRKGDRVTFEYAATIDLDGNHITFLGTQMPDAYAAKKVNVDCYYNGSAWIVDYQPAFDEAAIITSSMIDSIAVAKITGTASKVMEFTAGGVGQASTTTTTELGYLAGTTPGTVVANKAIVPTTGKAIDEIDVTTTLKKGGVEITASAAELNLLDTAVAGTIVPSKAVVVDSNGKVNTWDPTVLKINGYTINATGVELSELNGAGVVNADFVVLKDLAANGVLEADLAVLKDLAANGVVENDLALLAGAYAAGVRYTDIVATKADTAARVQVKTATYITDDTIDNATGIVVLTLTADTNLTLPDGSTVNGSKQVIEVIIKENAGAAYDVTFLDSGATFWHKGTSASNSMAVENPIAGSIIKLVNSDTNVWIIGTAATYVAP